jgi:AcrR family transcriptional regulator
VIKRDRPNNSTADAILRAAQSALMESGYAGLSTRSIAEAADVPLSQIHYHFGSKQNLVLAILDRENQRLIDRQRTMFESDLPLWKKWEQACDFLDDDLESGYVRILHEMIAAGWSDPDIAAVVASQLGRWQDLLVAVAREAEAKLGTLGPFTPEEIGVLASTPFIGAEVYLLLGVPDATFPARSALRKIGDIIRITEESSDAG